MLTVKMGMFCVSQVVNFKAPHLAVTDSDDYERCQPCKENHAKDVGKVLKGVGPNIKYRAGQEVRLKKV